MYDGSKARQEEEMINLGHWEFIQKLRTESESQILNRWPKLTSGPEANVTLHFSAMLVLLNNPNVR